MIAAFSYYVNAYEDKSEPIPLISHVLAPRATPW